LYRENKNYNNVAHRGPYGQALLCVASFKLQPVTCILQQLRTVYKQQNHQHEDNKVPDSNPYFFCVSVRDSGTG